MTATEMLRLMLDELGVKYYANDSERCFDEDRTTTWSYESYGDELTVTAIERIDGEGNPVTDADGNSHLVMDFHNSFTAEQAIAATLGDERLASLEEKVKLQGDYIYKLIKEKAELFAQNCEAATRHAGQMDRMSRELEAATMGSGECEWELEHSGTLYDKWRCSECKFLFVEPRCDQGYTDLVPNFCPNCGRKVVDA